MAAAARFGLPAGIAIDRDSNLYVADPNQKLIRKITPAAVVTTLAGSVYATGTEDGAGPAARFTCPTDIAVDQAGTIYVLEPCISTMRKITATGVVSTTAGSPTTQSLRIGGIYDTSLPAGLAVDAAGTLFFGLDTTLRKLTADGAVSTVAGMPTRLGAVDGVGQAALFLSPNGIAVGPGNVLYVTDTGNSTVRLIAPDGTVTTIAGKPRAIDAVDGVGTAARFDAPQGMAVDRNGNAFVLDVYFHTIRRITPTGAVTTLAGMPRPFTSQFAGAGVEDGQGPAARFAQLDALTIDPAGNLFVVEHGYVPDPSGQPSLYTGASWIRKVTPDGVVTTITSAITTSSNTSLPTDQFSLSARAITNDGAGNLYVGQGRDVLRIASDGSTRTIATFDNCCYITAITIDAGRNLYVNMTGNAGPAPPQVTIVRKIDTAGVVTTIAGVADGKIGVRLGSLPGHLQDAEAIAVDAAGNLYVTDANGVVRITP